MAYTFKHGDRPLDDYTIQRAVGRGGFGEVYYAISDGGREVALKYLKENPQVELRGVSHCINLKSPHLVSIFDVKKNAEGEYFIVMEYISGPSLRDLLIAEPKGFAPEKAAFFTREIGKGLAYLHDRGIVHRDMKPGNIFFDDGYVKIGDYGLSKFIAVSRHSVQTSSVGTVHYMAPEIGSGNYTRGVDIYALGVMLYEMLSGKLPFEGSTMAEVLMKHLTSQPELDNLPRPFGDVIRKALQKDPRDRYATVGEMMDEMLAGEEIQQSLAGFSTKSLEGAVRMGGQDRADSPMPSPNPSPRGFTPGGRVPPPPRPRNQQWGPLADIPLPDRVARKMERISEKIDKRMTKLGRRLERFGMGPPPQAGAPGGSPDAQWESPLGHVSPRKRMALIVFLLAAMSVGVGLATGGTMSHVVAKFNEGSSGHILDVGAMGAAAGMLVAALFGSIVLAQYMIRWFTVDVGPRWAQRLVRACCAAPILAAGAAPTFDEGYGLPIWLGLVGLATFADWDSDKARGYGKLSGGQVLGKALGALILTAIASSFVQDRAFRRLNENLVLISAGIAAAMSFVYQAKGAWAVGVCRVPRRGQWYPQTSPQADPRRMDETLPVGSPQGPYQPYGAQGAQPQGQYAAPGGQYAGYGVPQPATGSWHSRGSSHRVNGVPRWLIARMFWSLAAFVLMGGAIVAFIYTLVASNSPYHNITTSVILCTSFAAFMLYAFRKTTPLKRPGFWRESFRPFLVSLSLFGIGLTITLIAREWSHVGSFSCIEGDDSGDDDEAAADIQPEKLDRVFKGIPDFVPLPDAKKKMIGDVIAEAIIGHKAIPGPAQPCLDDEGKVACISGLVISSIMLLGLGATSFTGRRKMKPAPEFLAPPNVPPMPNAAIPTEPSGQPT